MVPIFGKMPGKRQRKKEGKKKGPLHTGRKEDDNALAKWITVYLCPKEIIEFITYKVIKTTDTMRTSKGNTTTKDEESTRSNKHRNQMHQIYEQIRHTCTDSIYFHNT